MEQAGRNGKNVNLTFNGGALDTKDVKSEKIKCTIASHIHFVLKTQMSINNVMRILTGT